MSRGETSSWSTAGQETPTACPNSQPTWCGPRSTSSSRPAQRGLGRRNRPPRPFRSCSRLPRWWWREGSARPGGNVTGISFQVQPDKELQLLKEAVPTLVRVGYLYDPATTPDGLSPRAKTAARGLNL